MTTVFRWPVSLHTAVESDTDFSNISIVIYITHPPWNAGVPVVYFAYSRTRYPEMRWRYNLQWSTKLNPKIRIYRNRQSGIDKPGLLCSQIPTIGRALQQDCILRFGFFLYPLSLKLYKLLNDFRLCSGEAQRSYCWYVAPRKEKYRMNQTEE